MNIGAYNIRFGTSKINSTRLVMENERQITASQNQGNSAWNWTKTISVGLFGWHNLDIYSFINGPQKNMKLLLAEDN